MNDQTITNPEAVQELLSSPDQIKEEADAQQVPVQIHTPDGVFVVDEVEGWQYMQLGIFAHGRWYADGPYKDVLIPFERIKHLEFDFDALERYRAAQESESSSD